MEHDKKTTDDLNSVAPKLVYEKPALTPLGHMAQVTQKSGAMGDNSTQFPTAKNLT